jgi:adhesin/invasin
VAEGKTVSATINGTAITQTAAVTVNAGAATQVALNAGNNQTATVNTTVATAPSVIVRDQFNNPVAGHTVTFTVTGGGGSISPASPANVQTNASGVASITSWTLGTTAGTNNNTLTATATSLTGSPVTFTASATPGAAASLVFTQEPTDVVVNAAISPPVTVAVRDAFDNTVTEFVGSITLSLSANPGPGTLGGTTTRAVSSGVAVFDDLSIDVAENGYRLGATDGTRNAQSALFNVTP